MQLHVKLMSRDICTVILCACVMLLVGLVVHCCSGVSITTETPEQLTLPMPLDDGTRNEIAVYSIETEVSE